MSMKYNNSALYHFLQILPFFPHNSGSKRYLYLWFIFFLFPFITSLMLLPLHIQPYVFIPEIYNNYKKLEMPYKIIAILKNIINIYIY